MTAATRTKTHRT